MSKANTKISQAFVSSRVASLNALDVVTLRISQARAVLTALDQPYIEQDVNEMKHVLQPGSMLDALSAAGELLDQASAAATKIIPG